MEFYSRIYRHAARWYSHQKCELKWWRVESSLHNPLGIEQDAMGTDTGDQQGRLLSQALGTPHILSTAGCNCSFDEFQEKHTRQLPHNWNI
mmetsp:Transcript_25281/g.32824  ORF Transcript_25281/g.32824 Transcript_25281/m.32824 type:complete len:91 (+) Transcript_25281:43-315(+)